jgi:copper chaperone CopZ
MYRVGSRIPHRGIYSSERKEYVMERISLRIEGMSCGHCVEGVRRALEGMDGVRADRVEVGSASVAYDPTRTDIATITQAVEEAGYVARPESLT